ncbi:hypothetical protein [Streptomyces venezuelae]|uniref:hypothetical protein n=1 Tax=Streptomyces venezuelae TaxID=54571 RepID=UPI00123A5FCE|nr:hypothetical protein [Streptomyces venezuelae]
MLYVKTEYVEVYPDQVYEIGQALMDEYRAADDAWRTIQGKLESVMKSRTPGGVGEGEGA